MANDYHRLTALTILCGSSCLQRADIIKVFDGRDTNAPAIAMLCNELSGNDAFLF